MRLKPQYAKRLGACELTVSLRCASTESSARFRLAALQLDGLRICRNRPAIETALRNLPKTLNDTYTHMLTSIQQSLYCREVTVILQMLLWCDMRPTLEACNDAIIVQPGKQPGFSSKDRFFDPHDIVSICSGLVTIVCLRDHLTMFEERQYLQLAHASVWEYLSSEEVIQPFQSHLAERVARSDLLRLCHAYFCCFDWSTLARTFEMFRQQTFHRDLGLLIWDMSTWLAHAKFLEAVDDDGLASVVGFLQHAPEQFLKTSIGRVPGADRKQCYPLYLAALLGLRRSCAQLAQFDIDACSTGPHSDNSILAASVDGNDERIHKSLGSIYMNLGPAVLQTRLDAAVLAAATEGHDGIVQDLLDRGAHPDAVESLRDPEKRTALHVPVWKRRVELAWKANAHLGLPISTTLSDTLYAFDPEKPSSRPASNLVLPSRQEFENSLLRLSMSSLSKENLRAWFDQIGLSLSGNGIVQ